MSQKIKFNFGNVNEDILLSREQYFKKQFLRSKSIDSENTARGYVKMLDIFTNDIYQYTIEELVQFIKSETKDSRRQRNSTVHLLEEFNQWLQEPHPHIPIQTGRPQLDHTKTPRRSKYVKKKQRTLKGQGFLRVKGTINGIKKFLSLTQGIELSKGDIDRVINYPVMPEDRELDEERAEPTTSQQMREVIELQRNIRSRCIYEIANDAGFRMIEMWKLQEKDIKWGTSPLEIKLLPSKSKGGYGAGTRYVSSKTERDIKRIVKDDPENHFLRLHDKQSLQHFRDNERKKIRIIYNHLKMTQKYADSGQCMYNLHSIRKRCTTQYGKKHGEAMGHSYGRHKKYLGQYNAKSEEERRQMFLEAQIFMSWDELEKEKAKSKALEIEQSEFVKLQDRVDKMVEESKRSNSAKIIKLQKQIDELQNQ